MPVQELATWEGHWTGHLHRLLWLFWLCWKWGRWWYCESLKIVAHCFSVSVSVCVCYCSGPSWLCACACVWLSGWLCITYICKLCLFDVCVCGCVFSCIIPKRYKHLRSVTLVWLAISQQIQDFLFLLSMILERYRIPWWFTFIGNLGNAIGALQKRVLGQGCVPTFFRCFQFSQKILVTNIYHPKSEA